MYLREFKVAVSQSHQQTKISGTAKTMARGKPWMRRIRDLKNRDRAHRGLRPLELCSQLISAAGKHSAHMARSGGHCTHRGSNGSTPRERIRAEGYISAGTGENVGAGQHTTEEIYRDWMASPGHRRLLLARGYTHMGLGFARGRNGRRYWTQVFGDR